jgi:hypothetical protein
LGVVCGVWRENVTELKRVHVSKNHRCVCETVNSGRKY